MDEFDSVVTQENLDSYARVLVNCGLGNGEGISMGDIVLLSCNQFGAEKIASSLQKAVTEAGGNLIVDVEMEYPADKNPEKILSIYGTTAQVSFLPSHIKEANYKLADHLIRLRSPIAANLDLQPTSPTMKERERAKRPLKDIFRHYRDSVWKSSTLAYLPTPQMAKKIDVPLKELWSVLIESCSLDSLSAVDVVRQKMRQVRMVTDRLNSLNIKDIHITGPNVDLNFELHPDAIWRGGNGSNMPSFECYTSPLATKTFGWINISYPLYHNGGFVTGLKLHFMDGRISEWEAETGSEVFAELLEYENFDRIGEVAFTDSALSTIHKPYPSIPMFIENMRGTGHIALGNAYRRCVKGDDVKKIDLNSSQLHKDMVYDSPFGVRVTGFDGVEREIYKDSTFQV